MSDADIDICDIQAHRVRARITLGRLVVTCEDCGRVTNHDIPITWLNETGEREAIAKRRADERRNRVLWAVAAALTLIGLGLIAWSWGLL